jgi:hypothetical protein
LQVIENNPESRGIKMNTNTIEEPLDLTETHRIPAQSMQELVYGPAPRRSRFPLPRRLIFVAAIFGMNACATMSRPVAVDAETVGSLSASYHSVVVAPLKHDAPPEMGGVAGSDDEMPTTTALDVLRQEAAQMGAIDVATKTDGIKAGETR